ncbi:hypothetical protein [Haloterrigena salina]|uniref:hypothetical protein n=1 Tax=Haloterrigena salina TaxID=504937 RepID=UPI001EF9F646|nr:hypothetical protein [Haloterrigena salina]
MSETDRNQEFVFGTKKQSGSGYGDWETAAELQTLVERIQSTGTGRIKFWSPEEYEFHLYVRLCGSDTRVSPPVWIWGPHARMFSTDEFARERVEHRTEMLVDLFVRLVTLFEPWYAFTHAYDEQPSGIVPDDSPPESGIERLPWLSFFGSEWYDRFGGRDRLLAAPAWKVHSMDTGILIREHDFPTANYADIDRGSPLSTYEYLFEQRSLSELRAERQRKKNTVRDPFLELEPGDRGCDIVACKTHISPDTTEDDYREITDRFDTNDRCYVLWVQRDEHDRLREVDTGLFVRRLVDATGTPIGDRPEHVPPERELISLSVRNELDSWPVEFFEMETEDEPSTAGRVFGLHRVPADGFWRHGDECPRELLEKTE